MKQKSIFFALVILLLLFSSCGITSKLTQAERAPAFYTENPPVSILVMPPINQTTNVEAKDFFYYTMNQCLGDSGYYVFPPLLSMQTLQNESAYDSELFINGDIAPFGGLFGADMLLFTTITKWYKHPILSRIDIEIKYELRTTKDNATVWHQNTQYSYKLTANMAGGGLIGLASFLIQKIANSVTTAITDYALVAWNCNKTSFINVPYGKYSKWFQADGDWKGLKDDLKFSTSALNHPYTSY